MKLIFFLFLFLFLSSSFVLAEENLYELLGLTRDATESQIKKAYRKLSLKYHPDKNPGDEEALKKFQRISYANEVLTNAEKRQVYDLHGEEGLNRNSAQQQHHDPFGGLFGNRGGGGVRKGPDFRMDLPVTLEELYNGGSRNLQIKRKVVCKACRGTGAADGAEKKCNHCNGQGVTMVNQQIAPGFTVQMQQTCPTCQGRGKIATKKCKVCKGDKIVHEDKILELVIEKGMREGEEVVFERESEQPSPDVVPGDVIVALRQTPHHLFRRDGDDLHFEKTISLRDSLLGFSHSFIHLDHRKVSFSLKDPTSHGSVHRLKHEGMPKKDFSSERGDLNVHFKVSFPTSLTEKEKEMIRAAFS